MSCCVEHLKNVDLVLPDERLKASKSCRLFDGLIIKGNELGIDTSYLSCCKGSGFHFSGDVTKDIGTGHVYSCDIKKRHSETLNFFTRYKKHFPTKSMVGLSGEQISFLANWADNFSNGLRQGQAIQIENSQNSIMWPIALYFIWHKGIRVKTVYLEKEFESDIFDGIDRYDLVLLDGVAKLYDQSQMIKLDRLINYCYSSEIPLWVFFPKISIRRPPSGKRLRFFEKRLQALKAKSPLSHLTESCLSKLEDVCLGLERIPR
jgi:hypothetical protein